MKNNSPRKKNVSKKRNSSKKNGYPKKKSIITKKPTKKVAFKNFLRSKASDIWRDRERILLMLCLLAFPASLYFISYVNPYNDSTICTVTSVEIVEHEDPYSISGEFETEECGIITSSKSPDGIPIRKYLQNFETMNSTSASSALKRSKSNPTPTERIPP